MFVNILLLFIYLKVFYLTLYRLIFYSNFNGNNFFYIIILYSAMINDAVGMALQKK